MKLQSSVALRTHPASASPALTHKEASSAASPKKCPLEAQGCSRQASSGEKIPHVASEENTRECCSSDVSRHRPILVRLDDKPCRRVARGAEQGLSIDGLDRRLGGGEEARLGEAVGLE